MTGHRRRWWLYAAAALIILFLILPVFLVVPMSFSSSRYLEFPPPGWSMRWYERFFGVSDWGGAMIVSLKLAFSTAILTAPVGVAAAYAIHHSQRPMFRRLETIMLLPLMVPHMIIAAGIFYCYVRLEWLGSLPGLVMANVMLGLPFVVVSTLAGLRSFDNSQELVARVLGCSRLRAFWSVTLPQIKGAVLTGVLFAFVSSLDEVVVALFAAVGKNVTITKVMFDSMRDEIDPTIAAVSSMLIFASMLGFALTLVVQGASRKRPMAA